MNRKEYFINLYEETKSLLESENDYNVNNISKMDRIRIKLGETLSKNDGFFSKIISPKTRDTIKSNTNDMKNGKHRMQQNRDIN